VATAKVFKSGNSQAVRLPKEFRFSSKEVQIERRGREIVLTEPRPRSTAYGRRLVKLIQQLPDDMIDAVESFEDQRPEPTEDFS
jgi:antitoxin VapB